LFFLLLLFISAGKPEESKKKLREPVNGLRKRTKNKAEENAALSLVDSPVLYGDRVETSKPYHLIYIDRYEIVGKALSAELDAVFLAHGFYTGQRFHTDALAAEHVSAGLKRFFNTDAAADERCAGLLHQLDETAERSAVGKKIVNDEYAVVRAEKILGNDDIVYPLVSVGADFRRPYISCDIQRLAFLGKNKRTPEGLRRYARNTDTGCLDRKNLIDTAVVVQALKLFGKFGEEHDVHLMVQKTVHLQNAAVTHYTIAADPIFEELHPYHPHGLT